MYVIWSVGVGVVAACGDGLGRVGVESERW